MPKAESIIKAVQKELGLHAFDTFKTGVPPIVITGCTVRNVAESALSSAINCAMAEFSPAITPLRRASVMPGLMTYVTPASGVRGTADGNTPKLSSVVERRAERND